LSIKKLKIGLFGDIIVFNEEITPLIFRQHLIGEIECIEADVVLQLARTESMQALSTGN